MYLCYIDESGTPDIPGNTSHFVLAGLSVPIWYWKDGDRQVAAIKRRYGLENSEIHVAWLLRPYQEQNRVPNFDALEKWAREHGVSAASRAELVAEPRVIELYERTIASLTGDLAQFERIKKVRLLPREFTIDSGELTPTLKIRRKTIEQNWQEEIEAIYGA